MATSLSLALQVARQHGFRDIDKIAKRDRLDFIEISKESLLEMLVQAVRYGAEDAEDIMDEDNAEVDAEPHWR
jgi:hypothetical protein